MQSKIAGESVTERNKFLLIGALVVILGAAAWYVFGGNLPAELPRASAHVYARPEINLKDIQLDIFYTVPKNREAFDYDTLKSKLEIMMPKIASFHKSQFGDKSLLHYRIFSNIVTLQEEGIFYDTNDTRYGNPQALKNITLELEARVYDKEGDLYEEDFATPQNYNSESFRVIGIIYEGLGAAGTEGVVLLSRDWVTNKEKERGSEQPEDEYKTINASLFYHEFGHAMGIPEGYDIYTNRPFTNDIMGSGRRAPIEGNYIDQATLKEMGVF